GCAGRSTSPHPGCAMSVVSGCNRSTGHGFPEGTAINDATGNTTRTSYMVKGSNIGSNGGQATGKISGWNSYWGPDEIATYPGPHPGCNGPGSDRESVRRNNDHGCRCVRGTAVCGDLLLLRISRRTHRRSDVLRYQRDAT